MRKYYILALAIASFTLGILAGVAHAPVFDGGSCSDDGSCDWWEDSSCSDCSGGGGGGPPPSSPSDTGCNFNGFCDTGGGEDEFNCPSDCYCGDGYCSIDEQINGCINDCGPVCGDGICSSGESCSADCAVCGNGVKEGLEQCDGNSFGGQTCTNFGYTQGTLRCTSSCTLDFSTCYTCGNGIKEPGEQCDTSMIGGREDLGGETCQSLGYGGGTLHCEVSTTELTSPYTTCMFDTSGCYGTPGYCGDRICQGNENAGSCPVDCQTTGWTGACPVANDGGFCSPACYSDNACGTGGLDYSEIQACEADYSACRNDCDQSNPQDTLFWGRCLIDCDRNFDTCKANAGAPACAALGPPKYCATGYSCRDGACVQLCPVVTTGNDQSGCVSSSATCGSSSSCEKEITGRYCSSGTKCAECNPGYKYQSATKSCEPQTETCTISGTIGSFICFEGTGDPDSCILKTDSTKACCSGDPDSYNYDFTMPITTGTGTVSICRNSDKTPRVFTQGNNDQVCPKEYGITTSTCDRDCLYSGTAGHPDCDGKTAGTQGCSSVCQPVFTGTVSVGVPTGFSISNGVTSPWTKDGITASVSCSDSVWNCDSATATYKIVVVSLSATSCPAWDDSAYETTGTKTITTHTKVCAAAKNNKGVPAVSSPVEFRIETTAPTVSVSGEPAAWKNTDQTATINCNDDRSGCETTGYKIYSSDPGSCSTTVADYTQGATVAVDSHSWVCGYAKDYAGNTAFSSAVEFKVDKTQPVTTDQLISPKADINDAAGNPRTMVPPGSATITIAGSDEGGSQINKIEIYVGGTLKQTCPAATCDFPDVYTYAAPTTVGNGGLRTYYGKIYDVAGNVRTTVTKEFIVNTRPTTGPAGAQKIRYEPSTRPPAQGESVSFKCDAADADGASITSVKYWAGQCTPDASGTSANECKDTRAWATGQTGTIYAQNVAMTASSGTYTSPSHPMTQAAGTGLAATCLATDEYNIQSTPGADWPADAYHLFVVGSCAPPVMTVGTITPQYANGVVTIPVTASKALTGLPIVTVTHSGGTTGTATCTGSSSPYTCTYNVAGKPNGVAEVTAGGQAADCTVVGGYGTSPAVNFVIDTTAPVIHDGTHLVKVRAKATELMGTRPDMQVLLSGTAAGTSSNIGDSFSDYSFTVTGNLETRKIQVRMLDFRQEGSSTNTLVVDYITIDGQRFETSEKAASTCPGASVTTETLNCLNGQFEYTAPPAYVSPSDTIANTGQRRSILSSSLATLTAHASDTNMDKISVEVDGPRIYLPSSSGSHTLKIYATGTPAAGADPQLEASFAGSVVGTKTISGTGLHEFTFTGDTSYASNTIKLRLTNFGVSGPATRSALIDYIELDGKKFETNSNRVSSSCGPASVTAETLNCNDGTFTYTVNTLMAACTGPIDTCPAPQANYDSGTYNYRITATDKAGNVAPAKTGSFTSRDDQNPVIDSVSSAPSGVVAQGYTHTITVSSHDVGSAALNRIEIWAGKSGSETRIKNCNTAPVSPCPATYSAQYGTNNYWAVVADSANPANSVTSSVYTFEANDAPVVSSISFAVQPPITTCKIGQPITVKCSASDANGASTISSVRVWIGECNAADCANTLAWRTSRADDKVYANDAEATPPATTGSPYTFTIDAIQQAAGTAIAASCRATDEKGAASNWYNTYPLTSPVTCVASTCSKPSFPDAGITVKVNPGTAAEKEYAGTNNAKIPVRSGTTIRVSFTPDIPVINPSITVTTADGSEGGAILCTGTGTHSCDYTMPAAAADGFASMRISATSADCPVAGGQNAVTKTAVLLVDNNKPDIGPSATLPSFPVASGDTQAVGVATDPGDIAEPTGMASIAVKVLGYPETEGSCTNTDICSTRAAQFDHQRLVPYYYSVDASDRAGNQKSADDREFNVQDNIPPVIMSIAHSPEAPLPVKEDGLGGTGVTVITTAADTGGAGIKRIVVYLDGSGRDLSENVPEVERVCEQNNPAQCSIEIPASQLDAGIYRYYATVEDMHGAGGIVRFPRNANDFYTFIANNRPTVSVQPLAGIIETGQAVTFRCAAADADAVDTYANVNVTVRIASCNTADCQDEILGAAGTPGKGWKVEERMFNPADAASPWTYTYTVGEPKGTGISVQCEATDSFGWKESSSAFPAFVVGECTMPVFSEFSVTPSPVKGGTQATITFRSSVQLAAEPFVNVVLANGDEISASSCTVSQDGNSYKHACSFSVLASHASGPAIVTVTGSPEECPVRETSNTGGEFRIDNDLPVILSVSVEPQDPTVYDNDVKITVHADDATTEVANVKIYAWPADSEQLVGDCSYVPCASSGRQYAYGNLRYRVVVTDEAGNAVQLDSSTGVAEPILVGDPLPPSVSVPTLPTGDSFAVFKSADFPKTLEMMGSDPGGSGIASVVVKLDGETVKTCSSLPCTFTINPGYGTHNYEIRATDAAGNAAVLSGTFGVNDAPGHSSLDYATPNAQKVCAQGEVVTFLCNPNDRDQADEALDVSGRVGYCRNDDCDDVDDVTWINGYDNQPMTYSGTHGAFAMQYLVTQAAGKKLVFGCTAVDEFGGQSPLDVVFPICAVNECAPPAFNLVELGPDKTRDAPVYAKFSWARALKSMSVKVKSAAGAVLRELAACSAVAANRQCEVLVDTEGLSGNVKLEIEGQSDACTLPGGSSKRTAEFLVDRAPPETEALCTGAECSRPFFHGVSLELECEDETSCGEVWYSINGAEAQSYTGELDLTEAAKASSVEPVGTLEVKFWSVDEFGNEEQQKTVQVKNYDITENPDAVRLDSAISFRWQDLVFSRDCSPPGCTIPYNADVEALFACQVNSNLPGESVTLGHCEEGDTEIESVIMETSRGTVEYDRTIDVVEGATDPITGRKTYYWRIPFSTKKYHSTISVSGFNGPTGLSVSGGGEYEVSGVPELEAEIKFPDAEKLAVPVFAGMPNPTKPQPLKLHVTAEQLGGLEGGKDCDGTNCRVTFVVDDRPLVTDMAYDNFAKAFTGAVPIGPLSCDDQSTPDVNEGEHAVKIIAEKTAGDEDEVGIIGQAEEKFLVSCNLRISVSPIEKRVALGASDTDAFTVAVWNPLDHEVSYEIRLEPQDQQKDGIAANWLHFATTGTSTVRLNIGPVSSASDIVFIKSQPNGANRAGSYTIKFSATSIGGTYPVPPPATGSLLVFAEALPEFTPSQLFVGMLLATLVFFAAGAGRRRIK